MAVFFLFKDAYRYFEMYWRQSIPLFGGLKYNRTSNGKDYISYRKNGMYIREPVSDLKKDIKNIFHLGRKTLDVDEVQKKIKDNFDTYNDAEIFDQVDLLKQFNVSNDDIVDVVGSSIFDGSSLSIHQLNHAKGIFSQLKCSKSKRNEINLFIDDWINKLSQQSASSPVPSSIPGKSQSIPAPANNTGVNVSNKPVAPVKVPNSSPAVEYTANVDIFREENNQFNKVSSGQCKVINNKVIISANVTKSFEIKDIAEIYKSKGKLFIYIKTRKQPFILASNDIDDLFDSIAKLFSSK